MIFRFKGRQFGAVEGKEHGLSVAPARLSPRSQENVGGNPEQEACEAPGGKRRHVAGRITI